MAECLLDNKCKSLWEGTVMARRQYLGACWRDWENPREMSTRLPIIQIWMSYPHNYCILKCCILL